MPKPLYRPSAGFWPRPRPRGALLTEAEVKAEEWNFELTEAEERPRGAFLAEAEAEAESSVGHWLSDGQEPYLSAANFAKKCGTALA